MERLHSQAFGEVLRVVSQGRSFLPSMLGLSTSEQRGRALATQVQIEAEQLCESRSVDASNTSFFRDFGDSYFRHLPDRKALVGVLPEHKPKKEYLVPSAMLFGVAQQWAQFGLFCTHGSLVQFDGEGVLVLGARGAGKSIVTASALAAGGSVVSDDHLLVGERDSRYYGERVRHYLALRNSWATEHLIPNTGIDWTPINRGRRQISHIHSRNPFDRFPVSCAISHVLFLVRPRIGRQAVSSIRQVSNATAYSSFVAAVSPLLLSKHFPLEAQLIRDLIMKLIASVPCVEIESGQDIVLAPEKAWARLLRA